MATLKFDPHPADSVDPLQTAVSNLGISQIRHHLFLCADPSKPKCCPTDQGLETWNYLKARLQELSLDRVTPDQPYCVYRTKANCLRVCHRGPILVVYPDRVWYHSVTPEVAEEIIQRHILGQEVVQDYAFYQP